VPYFPEGELVRNAGRGTGNLPLQDGSELIWVDGEIQDLGKETHREVVDGGFYGGRRGLVGSSVGSRSMKIYCRSRESCGRGILKNGRKSKVQSSELQSNDYSQWG
jgi:hypothetical protein